MTIITIKDIARICSVSISTVSRAMNNDPGISDRTKARVLKAVKKYNYIPNNSARNLKMAGSNTIALLIKGIDNPFFHKMYPYYLRELAEKGYQFMLHMITEQEDETYVVEEIAKEKRLKGVILLGGLIHNPEELLERMQIPMVICSATARSEADDVCRCSSVGVDDVRESRRAVEYLCRMGHRRIAMITGRRSDTTVGRDRLEGYRQALEAYGIEYDPDLVGYMKDELPEYSEANGYAVAHELLASGKDFTAIFAISDRLAVGVYKAIYETGRRVPDDCSVVGFDGIELTEYMYPPLTTVIQPVEEMVHSCIELLMKQLHGNREYENRTFEARLCVRDSVLDLNQHSQAPEQVR